MTYCKIVYNRFKTRTFIPTYRYYYVAGVAVNETKQKGGS